MFPLKSSASNATFHGVFSSALLVCATRRVTQDDTRGRHCRTTHNLALPDHRDGGWKNSIFLPQRIHSLRSRDFGGFLRELLPVVTYFLLLAPTHQTYSSLGWKLLRCNPPWNAIYFVLTSERLRLHLTRGRGERDARLTLEMPRQLRYWWTNDDTGSLEN